MNYEFKITPDFARDFKVLAKKNKHLADDFDRFLKSFVHTLGDIIPGTGGAYKIRMSATGTGKRGGYRLIYYFFHENEIYFLKKFITKPFKKPSPNLKRSRSNNSSRKLKAGIDPPLKC